MTTDTSTGGACGADDAGSAFSGEERSQEEIGAANQCPCGQTATGAGTVDVPQPCSFFLLTLSRPVKYLHVYICVCVSVRAVFP